MDHCVIMNLKIKESGECHGNYTNYTAKSWLCSAAYLTTKGDIIMKRKKVFLIVVSTFAVLALGAVAVNGAILYSRQQKMDDGAFINENAALTKSHTTADGSQVALKYVESEEISTGTLDVYTDADGNQYRYDNSGALYDYRPVKNAGETDSPSAATANSTADTAQTMNMDKALKLADQYASDFCGEDFDRFELAVKQHQETLGDYFFEYRVVYSNGIIGEICLVTLEPNGDLRQITRPYENMLADFDPAILETIDQNQFNAAIKNGAEAQYPGHHVSYTIDNVYVNEQDGKPGLLAHLIVTLDMEPGTTNAQVFYPFES